MAFLEEYTKLDELGRGSFATVYKVRHKELDYIRAVRVLDKTITDGENDPIYKKFLDECKILLRLGNGNHANIVHIYQPALKEQHALVEMDYVKGLNLTDFMQQNSFIEVHEVIKLLNDIGSALAYCHEDIYKFCYDKEEDNLLDDPTDGSKIIIDEEARNRLIKKYRVIHNDIHSGNIIRREDGNYILLDFGLAIEGTDVARSSIRCNGGAPEFKSPEKWENSTTLTPESDIYSFGVLLYGFLSSQLPFPINKQDKNIDRAIYNVYEAHLKETPKPIFSLRKKAYERSHPGHTLNNPDYPKWLEDLIMKCLSKNPKDRFKSGKELYEYTVKQSKTPCNIQNNILLSENEQLRNKISSLEQKISNIPCSSNSINTNVCFIERINNIEIPFICVIGGDFEMGANGYETDESPQHSVTLSSFLISKFQITQSVWKAIMGTDVRFLRNRTDSTLPLYGESKNHPIYYVSWNDAIEFCKQLSTITGRKYTLPSEAQWEYAAKGGIFNSHNKYSGSNNIEFVAHYKNNSNNIVQPVGNKEPNELGIYDMSGNVKEWCLDWYGSYSNAHSINPISTTRTYGWRVLRGGCILSGKEDCRVTKRFFANPQKSDDGICSFRIVCEIV